MTNKLRTALTLGFLLIASGTMYWLFRQKTGSPAAPAGSTAAMPAAPENPIHEIASLEASLKETPNHLPILLRLAELEHQTGKNDKALEHLREAVKAEPKNGEAHLELGRLLFETNDFEGAITATNEAIKIDPKNVDALYNLGAIYGNLNKDGLAREYWNRAIAAAPNSESAQKATVSLAKLSAAPAAGALPSGHPAVK